MPQRHVESLESLVSFADLGMSEMDHYRSFVNARWAAGSAVLAPKHQFAGQSSAVRAAQARPLAPWVTVRASQRGERWRLSWTADPRLQP
jgi:hypothetical protein